MKKTPECTRECRVRANECKLMRGTYLYVTKMRRIGWISSGDGEKRDIWSDAEIDVWECKIYFRSK